MLYLEYLGMEQHLIAVPSKLLLMLDAQMMYLFLGYTQAVLSQLQPFMALLIIMNLITLPFIIKLESSLLQKLLTNIGLKNKMLIQV